MSIGYLFIYLVPSLPGESPVEIELTYTTMILSPGEEVTIYCRVNCTSSFGWTFNGGSLPSNAKIFHISGLLTRLLITNGSLESAGFYTCFVQSATEAYSATSSVEVKFYGKNSQTSKTHCF